MRPIFIGTYTAKTTAQGFYSLAISDDCLTFDQLAVQQEADNPSWLARHPVLPVLYAVSELGESDGGGYVSAYEVGDDGQTRLLAKVPSMGADPCHLAVDPGGRFLAVSNYSSGNLATFALQSDGTPGDVASVIQHGGKSVDPMRQKGPHVHSVTLADSGQRAYVADLGTDEIVMYKIHSNGVVDAQSRRAHRMKPGAGPRLGCMNSSGTFLYFINELDNTLVSFARDDNGELVELETTSSLPVDYADASYCGHIALSADDRFLYASNRGHDSIAVFSVREEGVMELLQHISSGGRHPRHFSLSPGGGHLLVANRDDNNLVTFLRNPESGTLTRAGTYETPAPVCICF